MKNYKRFELIINTILISFFLLIYLLTKNIEPVFIGYFAVGAVQLLSIVIHIIKGWFTGNASLRTFYNWFLLVLAALLPTGISIYFLLFASPLLALFYLFICYREWRVLKFKELIHLK
ncbi:MAG: hypothetical protein K2X48_14720 [Chitinophagaceae bacterium]|nr:hypothetical protein [Chitinophagaceae bacterium]